MMSDVITNSTLQQTQKTSESSIKEIFKFYKKNLQQEYTKQIKKISKEFNESNIQIISIFHFSGEMNPYKSSYSEDHIKFFEKYNQNLFNNLFSSIKKNRKRDFGQNKLSLQEFNFIGTYQTEAFRYQKIRCVILIGRNEFLPFNLDKNKSKMIERISTLSLSYYLKFKELQKQIEFQKIKFNSTDIFKEHFQENKIIPKSFFHQQRIQLLGELLNTLKHELSNPLFGISLGINILKNSKWEDPQTLNELDIMDQNTIKCSDLIDSFSSIYTQSITTEDANLIEVIEKTLMLLKSELKKLKFEFNYLKNEVFFIYKTVPNFISQIIFNLVINSIHAVLNENIKEPKVSLSINRNEKSIEVIIDDNGPGIKVTQLDKLFEPFYTNKENGNGLGLSISRFLAQKLSGSLEYCPETNNKTRFILTLPLHGQTIRQHNEKENTHH
ncbi:HAMP domain-containing histidine kinase [Bacteriovoracaceae bacterium]|nr:HAMP domain-containing histidine kinase [Bacteriovoracaceae bacterium]